MAQALVWFKRDLRVADHAPLSQASLADAALALVIIEPQWLGSPECHPRHQAYLLRCLDALARSLARRGLPLVVRCGDAVEVLQHLRDEFAFTQLLSHEETGPGWSYQRDRAVAAWCRASGVTWTEWPQNGVVRRLRDRHGWAARWQSRMDAPLVAAPARFRAAPGFPLGAPLPPPQALGLHETWPGLPPAGEDAARSVLEGFIGGRATHYRQHLSSPLTAELGCSRLSEHLAFGTISLRTVHQATERAIRTTSDRELAHGLRGFAGRLRWHCHFIQKLEDEPDIEWRNFARSVDGLRPGDGVHPEAPDALRLQAWQTGRTGYPMVDACMRQLVATGWLNFRMRAMLVSFAAYHLGLHWREPGLFLARQFLDFEPGIHWSQMQMQSGTTGINTLRIYSPTKQARDHDPTGSYVRRWVPEIGTPDYPPPIVDERSAVADIRARLHALRQSAAARDEAGAIQQKHGSRKSGLPPSGSGRRRTRSVPPGQGRLF